MKEFLQLLQPGCVSRKRRGAGGRTRWEAKSDVLSQPEIDEFVERQFKIIESKEELIQKEHGDKVKMYEGEALSKDLGCPGYQAIRWNGQQRQAQERTPCITQEKELAIEEKKAQTERATAKRHRKEMLLRRYQREIKLAQAQARVAQQQQQPTSMSLMQPTLKVSTLVLPTLYMSEQHQVELFRC